MSKYRILFHNKQQVIIDTETGQQVSQYWKQIEPFGLVEGTSEYYIAQNQNRKWAIFHKDNPDTPISKWHECISSNGLLIGQSQYYYAALNQKGRTAIFHKDEPKAPISNWWYEITSYGLLQDRSEYYLARNQDWQQAIFHKDNPDNPISNWHENICPTGLVNGTSEYYATSMQNNFIIQIYHTSNISQPLYELQNIEKELLVYYDDQYAIYLTPKYLMLYDNSTIEHNILAFLTEEMQGILHKIYKSRAWIYLDITTTNQLIAEYIQHDFIPIVFDTGHQHECYLYTSAGKYIDKFNSTQHLREYIQQKTSKNINNTSCDILQLY